MSMRSEQTCKMSSTHPAQKSRSVGRPPSWTLPRRPDTTRPSQVQPDFESSRQYPSNRTLNGDKMWPETERQKEARMALQREVLKLPMEKALEALKVIRFNRMVTSFQPGQQPPAARTPRYIKYLHPECNNTYAKAGMKIDLSPRYAREDQPIPTTPWGPMVRAKKQTPPQPTNFGLPGPGTTGRTGPPRPEHRSKQVVETRQSGKWTSDRCTAVASGRSPARKLGIVHPEALPGKLTTCASTQKLTRSTTSLSSMQQPQQQMQLKLPSQETSVASFSATWRIYNKVWKAAEAVATEQLCRLSLPVANRRIMLQDLRVNIIARRNKDFLETRDAWRRDSAPDTALDNCWIVTEPQQPPGPQQHPPPRTSKQLPGMLDSSSATVIPQTVDTTSNSAASQAKSTMSGDQTTLAMRRNFEHFKACSHALNTVSTLTLSEMKSLVHLYLATQTTQQT